MAGFISFPNTGRIIAGDGGVDVTSDYSTAIGYGAIVEVGTNSIAIGTGAHANTNLAIAIGTNALAAGGDGNSISIGYGVNCGSNSVAIGSNTFSNAQSVTIGLNATAAFWGVAIGRHSRATMNGAIAIGTNISPSSGNPSATANAVGAIAIGSNTNASASYSMALGYGASATSANTIRIGNVGTSSIGGYQAWTNLSDERDKTDIEPIEKSLEFINSIQPIHYVNNIREEYFIDNDDANVKEIRGKYGIYHYDKIAHKQATKKGERKRVGVLAQQVEQVLLNLYGTDNYADLVKDNLHDDKLSILPDGVESQKGVTYTIFIPFLIGAIQELTKRNEQLKIEIEQLKINKGLT